MKTTMYLLGHADAEAAAGTDAALDRLSLRQAEVTRDFLAVRPIDDCFCGPGRRAWRTASIIAAPHGLPVVAMDGLDDALRITDVLENLSERHAGRTLLIVAGHEAERCYLAGLLGISAEQAVHLRIDDCGISVVVRAGAALAVTTLNASFHLHGLAA